MTTTTKQAAILILVIPFLAMVGVYAIWAQNEPATQQTPARKLTLAEATMCEEIRDYAPFHPAIALPISLGKVVCYTLFDPVPEKTIIYHNWYRRDVLSTTIKLELKPPRWAAFSEIQLREADKGPWRVEVTDENRKVLHVLRFSITE